LKKFVESGQLGIFANGYWGHPAMKLPPEANLMATAHYLEALEWQKEIVKIHAIFGGKNPHPNFLVGGMACAINTDDASGLNAERLALVQKF
jgi:hydrogenase large subunit